MGGGGKGGSQTTEIAIPEYLEEPLKRNISKAEELAKLNFTPYFGADVAAMTPMQLAAGQNIGAASQAFGLGGPTSPTAGMQPAMNYGGIGAYSSAPLYEQALNELQTRMPGQYAALRAPFIDPVTGAQPLAPYGTPPAEEAAAQPTGGASAYYTPGSEFQGEGYYNVGGYPQYFTSEYALRRAIRQNERD